MEDCKAPSNGLPVCSGPPFLPPAHFAMGAKHPLFMTLGFLVCDIRLMTVLGLL